MWLAIALFQVLRVFDFVTGKLVNMRNERSTVQAVYNSMELIICMI
jgi:hypothetical protein